METSELATWVGKTETKHDVVTDGLVERYVATVGSKLAGRDVPATLGLHWCIAPAAVAETETGRDGHPARGGFLPPVPLPRRMWAGGRIAFHDLLRAGDAVTRMSRIADVQMKQGRTGPLCFVAVDHTYRTPRGLLVEERQDIVYREEPLAPQPLVGEPAGADRPGDIVAEIAASTLLLFRYSALTFNGHRIHYDRTHATEVEFYPGLVVHGPLQATLAFRLAAALDAERPIQSFSYRGVSPLIQGGSFRVRARRGEAGRARLSVIASDGRETMSGEASW